MKRFLLSTFMVSILFLTAAFVSAQNPSHLKWMEYESEHFIVYYPEGLEFTATKALEVAEAAHEPLVDMHGPVDSKISIVIKDDEDFAQGGAYYFDNKIEIYATSLDYDQRSYNDWLWNVVTHELTHIYSMHQSMKTTRKIPMAYYQHIDYQDEKREDVLVGYPNVLGSYPIPTFNVPSWLAEGVAQHQARTARFDRWDTHRDMIVRQAALNDKLLTIDEMAVFNWNGLGNEMVYNHGYALVRYISEHYGEEKVSELMKALGDPIAMTFNGACKRVLEKSDDDLYDEWKKALLEKYESVKESLGELEEGTPFRTGGYINAFPSWSPDGSRLAYISNKGQDYGIRVCFVANLDEGGWQWKGKEKDEKKLRKKLDKLKEKDEDPEEIKKAEIGAKGSFDIGFAGGIQTTPIWLDEWNVLYNRRRPSTKYGSHWWDIYRYVINTKDPRKGKEEKISDSLRGTYPDLSPDKSRLVYVKNEAGMNNLFIMNRDDNSLKQLTFYEDGTRLYGPKWSPDGSSIAFTIHRGASVDIASIKPDGTDFRYEVRSNGQDRDPAWTSDGGSLFFSSDITGIANIYRKTLADGTVSKLTNVIGGAFAPAPSPADTTLAFSSYGTDGYEIRLIPLTGGTPVNDSDMFMKPVKRTAAVQQASFDLSNSKQTLMKTLDFTAMPLIKNDQGNIKLGSYLLKSDVADRGMFLFSGAISPTNQDTDLYALFEYRKFVPTVFVEMIRLTRSVDTQENFMEEFGTVIKKRIYDLNEIDFGMRYTYKDRHKLEGRLIYSQYNAKLEYTHFLTGPQVHKPYYTYSRGFDLSFNYSFDRYIRARDEVINPRGGRKVYFQYDRMQNYFLDDFEYVGFLREKYKKYPYNQLYLNWVERITVPKTKKHTLLLRGQLYLIDSYVDDFYELQLGGPAQMRGYTFYSLSGRKTMMGQALYRFPILHDVRKKFFVWYFNHIYGGVYMDVGRAWNKRSVTWSGKGFVKDFGAELRFDLKSFYMFPTMIQLTAAYGPDDTYIKQFNEETSEFERIKYDQDPWKFYFTVLFGFFD